MQLLAPVTPNRGTRGIDAFGAGGYDAPRVKVCPDCAPRDDGGRTDCLTCGGSRVVRYQHRGVDFLAEPGDTVIAPLGGLVVHVGVAYPKSDLGSLHLLTGTTIPAFRLKLLYLKPSVKKGEFVQQGQPIGEAQDVAARQPKAGMRNHVHLELRVADSAGQRIVNPVTYLTRMVTA